MTAISLRLPEELEARLSEEAELEGKPRSEIAREAIADYLVRRERERFMAELVAEMREWLQDEAAVRESRDLAEEAMVTDNEALDLAEGRKPGEPWPEELGERWWK